MRNIKEPRAVRKFPTFEDPRIIAPHRMAPFVTSGNLKKRAARQQLPARGTGRARDFAYIKRESREINGTEVETRGCVGSI